MLCLPWGGWQFKKYGARRANLIKRWYLHNNFSPGEIYVIDNAMMGEGLEILKETEKAVKFRAYSDWGRVTFWCPKSCLMENETEQERKWMEDREAKFEKGLKYNESLVKFGKEKGIKGIRTGLKTATLIRKISEAGYEVPERE